MNQKTCIRSAVLDLGSNTFKLMLVKQEGKRLEVSYETAATTRLGEGLARTGKINSSALKRGLKTLREFQKKIQKFGASHVIAAGTSALRFAKNRNAFLIPAEKILGSKIKIISGKKEAEIVFAGITSNPRWQKDEILNIDIGGGSVEFIHGKKGKILKCKSFPVGCVRLRELFLFSHPLPPKSAEKAKRFLEEKMRKALPRSQSFKLLSSGGTINALCAMQSGKKNPQGVEGMKITKTFLEKTLLKLSLLPIEKLRKIRGLPPERADIMIPGILILLVVMDILKQKQISCATRGLRYGLWKNFVLLKSAKKA